MDIIDGKIWVTEDAIAEQLVEKGVPKQDIVLAYQSHNMRKYREYAIG